MGHREGNTGRLIADIKSLAGASTADLIGIAPGEAFTAEEAGALGAQFGAIRSVIVLAQRIVDPVQLVRFYAGGTYDNSGVAASFCDALLRDACWRVVEIIREAGYRAAVLRNQRYGVDDPRHSISYKKAAVLAGLGAFGKSQLLIHPEWGPWIWLRAVVTDAPLAPDARTDFSPCDDCSLCIAACPSGALTEDGFNRAACEGFASDGLSLCGGRRISPLGRFNCGKCVRACPIGLAPPLLIEGAGGHDL
jgi:ferredoxin